MARLQNSPGAIFPKGNVKMRAWSAVIRQWPGLHLRMKMQLFFPILVAILLSMVTSKIVYFGFTPNYAADIFSKKAFSFRFSHDVYQYRVLGKWLLFTVDDWLSGSMPEKGAEPRILINTRNGSERFYYAFFYLNTFFLILTSIVLVLLLYNVPALRFSEAERSLILFLAPVLIGLSEFTVVMYDVSSYFFQLLILYVFLKYAVRYRAASLAAICLLIVLSTLNRESSALSVSMVLLLLFLREGLSRKALTAMACVTGSFVLTYVALRYFIVDPRHLRILNLQAGNLLVDTNIIGFIFWGLFLYLPLSMAGSGENRLMIGAFHLLSLPYIYTCLKDGVLWEVRLYIPLFLGSLMLCKLKPVGFRYQLTRLSMAAGRLTRKAPAVSAPLPPARSHES